MVNDGPVLCNNWELILHLYILSYDADTYIYTHTHTHIYICVCVYIVCKWYNIILNINENKGQKGLKYYIKALNAAGMQSQQHNSAETFIMKRRNKSYYYKMCDAHDSLCHDSVWIFYTLFLIQFIIIIICLVQIYNTV